MIRSFFYSEIMCGSGRRGGRGGRVHGQGSHHPSTPPNGLTAEGTKLMSLAAKMDIFLADVKKRKSTVMICALNGAPFSPPFLLPSRDPRGQHKCANEVSTYLATARGKLAPLPLVPPVLPLAVVLTQSPFN